MKTWILGTTVTVGLCANALATSSHLVYHCTFDDVAAITSPVVGEAGTKSAGKFVTGKIGNALQASAGLHASRESAIFERIAHWQGAHRILWSHRQWANRIL